MSTLYNHRLHLLTAIHCIYAHRYRCKETVAHVGCLVIPGVREEAAHSDRCY